MAPQLEIIKKRSTFLYVKNKGSFLKGKCFNVNYLEDSNLKDVIFVGYIASKKIGNAVKRNRAKRLMRELVKKIIIKYGKINSYYVLIAKPSLIYSKFSDLLIELERNISDK